MCGGEEEGFGKRERLVAGEEAGGRKRHTSGLDQKRGKSTASPTMPRLQVSRSIEIEAGPSAVRALVRDFKQWPRWSPWLVAEPEARLDFRSDGAGYSWDGQIVGAGEIEVVDESDSRIDLKLAFLRPFRSVNRTAFVIESEGSRTRLTWTMDGSLPFFLFFMKRQMEGFIAGDYDRGLKMIKELAETGELLTKVDFPGLRSFPGAKYVGIRTTCPIPEIGGNAPGDLERTKAWFDAEDIVPSGSPLMICNRWDIVRGTCEYTIALPVAALPLSLPEGFVTGEIPACQTYDVRHTGAYRHLGNAWSTSVMHSRGGRYKMRRDIPPFETYGNDPSDTPEAGLEATVHFPAR